MVEQTTNNNAKLILIVDDSEDMRTLLGDFLQDEGYNVIFAEDGSTALIQARYHHPHLILMDISLPGMNGWETVILLRDMDEFRYTPIIAVTANATKQDAEHSLAVGCNLHVSKPFDIETILEHVSHLVQEKATGRLDTHTYSRG
ncbi:MAG: response regulator [Ktedonobacteraceae bacterium]